MYILCITVMAYITVLAVCICYVCSSRDKLALILIYQNVFFFNSLDLALVMSAWAG